MTDKPLERIMIVDDEPFMRITIRAILRAVGRFVIEEAQDGTDALARIAGFRPDLVLCDVGMQPMGGLAFVEALRTADDDASREIPVIMLTADANEATIVNAGRLRISGYLLKPVSPKQVSALLHTIFTLPELPRRAV